MPWSCTPSTRVAAFYQRFGFVALPDHEFHLYLLVKDFAGKFAENVGELGLRGRVCRRLPERRFGGPFGGGAAADQVDGDPEGHHQQRQQP